MGQTIELTEPPAPPSNYVEVLGNAKDPESQCEMTTGTGNAFRLMPQMCQEIISSGKTNQFSRTRSEKDPQKIIGANDSPIPNLSPDNGPQETAFAYALASSSKRDKKEGAFKITDLPGIGNFTVDVRDDSIPGFVDASQSGMGRMSSAPPISPPSRPPCPPNIADLIAGRGAMPQDWFKPIINQVLLQASKTYKDRVDAGKYKEVGGWILISPDGQHYHAQVKPSEPEPKMEFDFGSRKYFPTLGDSSTSVILEFPRSVPEVAALLDAGWLVVSDFHSHADKLQSPGDDQNIAARRKTPGIWIYPDGTTQVYGPEKGILNVGVPKRCR